MVLKRILFATSALALLLVGLPAHAAEMKGGLGFHTPAFPLGIRHWMSDQYAIDLGLGFDTINDELSSGGISATDKTTDFGFDIGVPIVLKKWDRVRFEGRPGFSFANSKHEPPAAASVTVTAWQVTGELEVEIMLMDNVSISASHGLAYVHSANDTDPKETITTFTTTGNDFTTLGFHVYLW